MAFNASASPSRGSTHATPPARPPLHRRSCLDTIAAGVNITYKILYNDAVAMTGGQPLGGEVQVNAIARQMVAEGAEKVVVTSDEPEKYPAG